MRMYLYADLTNMCVSCCNTPPVLKCFEILNSSKHFPFNLNPLKLKIASNLEHAQRKLICKRREKQSKL